MKRFVIMFSFLLILIGNGVFAACIQGSGVCNDTFDSTDILSNEDIEMLINLGVINTTKNEVKIYGLEQIKAYFWSFNNGITTQESVKKANLGGNITREELAKMISNYAVNILGKTPDTTKTCLFIDSNINPNLVESVTKSCQLGLMGQGISSFRPKDSVTRAEFGTVLSRALWGNKNEGGSTYYENHLKALKSEGIMSKIDTPSSKEVRGYVMLMLMRSTNENAKVTDNTSTDDQISDVIKMLD